MREKILIIEDDVKIAKLLETELKFEGFDVDIKNDGKEGLLTAKYNHFDLILLDVMLPKMNGFEVCKRIREDSDVPIIFLTAKDQVTDKVISFDYGADDYITKPFSFDELFARIKALLRRANKKTEKKEDFIYEDLRISYTAYEVFRGDVQIPLSKKEFDLLDYLVLNKGIVLNRDNILEEVWGFDQIGNNNILDLYIKYLRDKIDKPFERKFIQTKRGIGFVFK
ncbi:response regulator transcription factor [Pseudostreptobacillus hongkongensis]|uniref:response regulator transcription factor n=1 Tax=Pseudostreptobacillus hongkongensis TaxID=1162717 RepID=UPI000836CD56|nr:response regulator transcription factor [Pseudostreptobacillus hongkongensis]